MQNVDIGLTSAAAWTHYAVVRNGTDILTFANGTLTTTASIGTVSLYYNSADTVVIGGQTSGTSRSVNGYIDELRVTKGIARYTTNFTPPTEPFLF